MFAVNDERLSKIRHSFVIAITRENFVILVYQPLHSSASISYKVFEARNNIHDATLHASPKSEPKIMIENANTKTESIAV